MSSADLVSVIFLIICGMTQKIHQTQTMTVSYFLRACIPVIYAAWKLAGIITDMQLMSLRKFDSIFEGHPTPRFALNEAGNGFTWPRVVRGPWYGFECKNG